jgi:hypothetical protein
MTTNPPTTQRATPNITAGRIAAETFTPVAARYWRTRLRTAVAAHQVGELVIGTARTLSSPLLSSAEPRTLGNVHRDFSTTQSSWAAVLGEPRTRLPWRWKLNDVDLAAFRAAFTETNQGAENLVVVDSAGVARWMHCAFDAIDPVPLGGGLYELEAPFEEAL